MLEAGFWGLVAGSSLVLGAALGIWLADPTADRGARYGLRRRRARLRPGIRPHGRGVRGERSGAAGLAMVLGALLDGLRESFVLGASLIDGAGGIGLVPRRGAAVEPA